ncbi:MAG: 30S ribosomal protein S6 [Acetobacteraceae bacterium]|nr:30S ribosomal protein S6 [Acetobacteraceae bacterium]
MRPYEVMVVLRPDLEEERLGELVERLLGVIQEQGGKVDSVDRWGKRRLAYEIADCREGYYLVIGFSSGPGVPREVSRVLGLREEVLRHLVVARPDVGKAAQEG